ncbi:unnamed protein product, partial [Hapterophycus canaliculatus]
MSSFAPPKTPSSFTVGKSGQDSTEASRRRNLSSARRNRSPSPLSRETLNGGRGGHAFNFCGEDAPTPLSALGSLHGRGGGGSSSGNSFSALEGAPTPLSISQTLKACGVYSFNRGHDSTAATVSPTGDERSSSFRSSAAAATATDASNPSAATDTDGAGALSPDTTVPTFSEIARGAVDRHGGSGAPLSREPFAKARVRAAEEGWARRDVERRERERRWWLRVLSVATLFVLVAVLICRCVGVVVTISGPTSTAAKPVGSSSRKGQTGKTAQTGTDGFLTAAAVAVGEMPVIVSSKDELVAALKLAGAKKPKPAQVDRAWSALVSGEARVSDHAGRGSGGPSGGGGAFGVRYYARGFFLAISVAAAAALRNPDFALLLMVAIAVVTAA